MKIQGANSVLNLSAPINKQCMADIEPEREVSQLYDTIENSKHRLGRYYQVFMLQYHSGCRITEILNITQDDITLNGEVYIRALKRGQNRVIFSSEARQYLVKSKRNNLAPFRDCNRFTARRILQAIGVGKRKKGRQVDSITHIFRDEYMKRMRSINMNERDRSNTIGHKSTKSTEAYGKD